MQSLLGEHLCIRVVAMLVLLLRQLQLLLLRQWARRQHTAGMAH
jgi:hypothetical protein